jgi:hypothetical protein
MERPAMVVGNAAGTKIDVQILVEVAFLLGGSVLGAFFGDDAAAPSREVAAPGTRLGLKHVAFESRTHELVSSSQTGDAGAQDQHRFALA